MPEGIIPDEGLARGLFWTLRNGDTELFAWEMLLFVNDLIPTFATVLADLVEPSWSSYGRVVLFPADWSDPVVADNVATSTWGTEPAQFTNLVSAAETVYGCAYVDTFNGVLRFVQRFDPGDIRAVAAGESVFVVPRFSRRSESP